MKRLLALFAALLLLIPSAMAEDWVEVKEKPKFDPLPWDAAVSPIAPHADGFLPDNLGYHDDSLDISIETIRAYDTYVMVARVTIADPSQLRAASAAPYPSKAATAVSSMAKKVKAVLAINGDYYSFDNYKKIVMRNGKIFKEQINSAYDTLVIDKNGDFHILQQTTAEAWAAVKDDAVHAYSFGPGLVVDGAVLTDDGDIHLNLGKERKTQRIAFCQTAPLQYMIVATEGPENKDSVGLTLLEMAELCGSLGAVNAYNLDGGSSSTICMNYKKVNSLSSKKVRNVGDCIWFATLAP